MQSATLHLYLLGLPDYCQPRSERLKFLYSSFASRKINNPTGYQSAIAFWQNLLTQLTQNGLLGDDRLILSLDESLKEKLRWEQAGTPLSLGPIVAELNQSKHLIALNAFLSTSVPTSNQQSSATWTSLLSRPLIWSFSRLKTTLLGDEAALGEMSEEEEWKKRQGHWVVRELVEKAANNLIEQFLTLHSDPISRLYTLKSFREKINTLDLLPSTSSNEPVFSERDCTVLLHYLALQRHCVLKNDAIKFSAPLATPSTPLPTITESDFGILTLSSTLATLSSYITSIESRIVAEKDKARSYLEKKQMAIVKNHLAAKKRLENLLEERVRSRDKLEEVLLGLERASSDTETIKALSLGTTTLRSILSSPELSLDHIEATNDALQDTLLDAKEINDAVSSGGVQMDSEQELEVEKELEELVKAEEKKEEEEKERKLRELEKAPKEKVGGEALEEKKEGTGKVEEKEKEGEPENKEEEKKEAVPA